MKSNVGADCQVEEALTVLEKPAINLRGLCLRAYTCDS